MQREWNEHYASGQMPWDSAEPDPELVRFIESAAIQPGPALDIGSGTGTNAIWLAERGFDVLGVDIAPLATEAARAKLAGRALRCRFETVDFLAASVPGARFELVFDRGCFHVFDAADDRARFASRVADALSPSGMWLSLIGSTEGAPRDTGPPRRSVRDIAAAIEPALELIELQTFDFVLPHGSAKAWRCLARRREVRAQPSTGG